MDLWKVRKKLNMGASLSSIFLRVVCYARVSTDHLEQKKSLQNQVEHFEEYIRKNENWTYIGSYVDDGITGTSDKKRDHFMKMIEDARSGMFDLIVTKEISRFSRNTLDSIKYTRLLLSYGVAVYFVGDNINTALPDSELRLTIMASMAQDEVRRLSERVKFGMNRAIERGEILGNDTLYGYRKEEKTKVLKVVEEEAKVVREIYEMYAIEKCSLSQIAKELNQRGITTKRGKAWSISTISRMIENPKYKGYYCGKKTEIIDYMNKRVRYLDKKDWVLFEDKERIPVIVDKVLWESANDRLRMRKNAYKGEKGKNVCTYLYSGKLYCKTHKSPFYCRKFRRGGKDVTWVCSEYLKKGKKFCDSPNIRESELKTIFMDIIKLLQIDFERVATTLLKLYKKEEGSFLTQRKEFLKRKEYLSLKKEKLLELSLDGSLSNKEFKERNNKLNKELEEIEKNLTLEKGKKKEKELASFIEKMLVSKEALDFTIKLLLHKIVVSKKKEDKHHLQLDIFLTIKEGPSIFKTYQFLRGYDTKGTKRYKVIYQVNLFYKR